MTQRKDIDHAIEIGANAVGLIFHPQSPRFVTIESAISLLDSMPPFINCVAVLVNPTKDIVISLLKQLPIDYLQFHGDESPQFCSQFNRPYIKTIPAKSESFIIEQSKKYIDAKALLLDTAKESVRGGTGETFDWNMIPDGLNKPIILAGGINLTNLEKAKQLKHIYALDVCSGIEKIKGIKDHQKMTSFLHALL